MGGVREREEGSRPDQRRDRQHQQFRRHASRDVAALWRRPRHGQPHQPHEHPAPAQEHEPGAHARGARHAHASCHHAAAKLAQNPDTGHHEPEHAGGRPEAHPGVRPVLLPTGH